MSSQNKTSLTKFLPLFALLAISFCLMLPFLPPGNSLNPDSGIFVYIGREISRGKLLYLDAWDHKGPLLFYINAFGYSLGKRTGIWVVEYFLLALSTTAGYHVIKKWLGPWAALYGNLAWFASFFPLIFGGNSVEEFSLPFGFLCILIFYHYLINQRPLYPVLIGAGLGMNLLLRPNNIGIQAIIIILTIFFHLRQNQVRCALNALLLVLLGLVLVMLPVLLFFSYQGTLSELIYASFTFNILYSNLSSPLLYRFSYTPLFLLSLGWPCWFAIIGWFLALFNFFSSNRRIPFDFNLFLLLSFPIEFILLSLSGRPYFHYLIMLMPQICLLNAFFLYRFWKFLKERPQSKLKIPSIALLISLLLISYWSQGELTNRIISVGGDRKLNENSPLIQYIGSNTREDDFVLVWGQEAAINVLAERSSPTPYCSQTTFLIPGVVNPVVEQLFSTKLIANRPKLIVITDALPFPGNHFDEAIPIPQESRHIFDFFKSFVLENYHLVQIYGNYFVYQINNQY